MKKWIVLLAGIVLQMVLGGIYAWSAFVPSLIKDYGLTNSQCGLIFGLTITIFTIAMIPGGQLLSKLGPRVLALIGAVLFTLGYLVASASGGSFAITFIGISVLTGAGIGAGYVCPLTVGMKWFPNNRGLVTGVAVAGFGGGAILLSYLAQYLMDQQGWTVMEMFRFIGIAMGGLAILASLFLSEPATETIEETSSAVSSSLKEHLLSKPFIFLTVGMFAGTFAGLMTVGHLKTILLDRGLDGKAATLGISIFAVGNALGRIIWGQIHDRLAVKTTIILSLLSLGISMVFLAIPIPVTARLAAVALIGSSFGACFVVYASSMVSYFGTELFPRLYPICFLGYGLAGIIGPATGGKIADATGTFSGGIMLSISIVAAAIVCISLGLKKNKFSI